MYQAAGWPLSVADGNTRQEEGPVGAPNQYHLTGDGVTVSYYPEGQGPIVDGQGPVVLAYEDADQQHAFPADQVDVTGVADVGTLVTAKLSPPLAKGVTAFSVMIPPVAFDDGEADPSVSLHVAAITTQTRTPPVADTQQATYKVTRMHGHAADGVIAF